MGWLVFFFTGLAIGFALGWLFRRRAPEEQTKCQVECGESVLSATCYATQADECIAALEKDCKERRPGGQPGAHIP